MQITLKEARKRAYLTQQEVANKLGITKQTLHNWENGKSKIKYSQLKRLCQIYGTAPSKIKIKLILT